MRGPEWNDVVQGVLRAAASACGLVEPSSFSLLVGPQTGGQFTISARVRVGHADGVQKFMETVATLLGETVRSQQGNMGRALPRISIVAVPEAAVQLPQIGCTAAARDTDAEQQLRPWSNRQSAEESGNSRASKFSAGSLSSRAGSQCSMARSEDDNDTQSSRDVNFSIWDNDALQQGNINSLNRCDSATTVSNSSQSSTALSRVQGEWWLVDCVPAAAQKTAAVRWLCENLLGLAGTWEEIIGSEGGSSLVHIAPPPFPVVSFEGQG